MSLDCQLGIVAMWGEWEDFVQVVDGVVAGFEVWEQNRVKTGCWLVLVLAGERLYKLGCDREGLKMIKGMFEFWTKVDDCESMDLLGVLLLFNVYEQR
ncbi:hypothetical protein Tco_1386132 [Tanacetum coccineum]